MRFNRARMLLGCAAFVAVAAVAYCCGPYGDDSQAALAAGVKVPGQIARSVIQGNVLIALLTDGQLIRINLVQGGREEPGDFRSAGFGTGRELRQGLRRIEESGDDRRPRRRKDHPGRRLRSRRQRPGLRQSRESLPPERAADPCARSGDREDGFMTSRLGRDDPKLHYRGYRTLGRSDKKLFVSVVREKDAVAVFDLDTNAKSPIASRRTSCISAPASIIRGPDAAFRGRQGLRSTDSRYGYGVWTEKLGVVDLKTRQYTALKLPAPSMQHPSLVAGPDGRSC